MRGNSSLVVQNLELWEQLPEMGGPGQLAGGAQIYSLLGRDEDAARLFELQQALFNRTGPTPGPAQSALAYLAVGQHDESLALLKISATNEVPHAADVLIHLVKLNLWNDPVLDQPEFVEVRRKLGYVE